MHLSVTRGGLSEDNSQWKPLYYAKKPSSRSGSLVFSYVDRTTKTYRQFSCAGEEFIERLTQHIPEKGSQFNRYYGFQARRDRSNITKLALEKKVP